MAQPVGRIAEGERDCSPSIEDLRQRWSEAEGAFTRWSHAHFTGGSRVLPTDGQALQNKATVAMQAYLLAKYGSDYREIIAYPYVVQLEVLTGG